MWDWIKKIGVEKPKEVERRKNRGEYSKPYESCVVENLIMRTALARISNMTKNQVDDQAFRLAVQNIAHQAISSVGKIERGVTDE